MAISDAPKQLQPWLKHVKKVKAKHPDMAYKDVLALAKKSYKSKVSPTTRKSRKATQKRLSSGRRLRGCKSPREFIGGKCRAPCSPSKSGEMRRRDSATHRCKKIKSTRKGKLQKIGGIRFMNLPK